MNRIQPYLLWLGHSDDCRDPQRLADVGIEAVVHLATEEPLPGLPREMLVFRIPLLDGSGNHVSRLRLVVELTVGLL